MSSPRWQPSPSFWRGRPVVVTGATGFVGSHLTDALVQLESDVIVLVRDDVLRSPIVDRWSHGVTRVFGTAEDIDVCERLLGEYRAATVFHLAAQSQVGVANANPVSTFRSNIEGTWNMLEAARRSTPAAELIVASSDKAYGTQVTLPYDEDMALLPQHPYDVSKACTDMLARMYHATYGLSVGVTRCGNVFGPGDVNWSRLVPSTMRSILNGEPPVIRSDGTPERDYLYVLDAVAAYLMLAERVTEPAVAGQAFNFSYGVPVTALDLVTMIQEAAGTDLKPVIAKTASAEIDRQYLSSAKARAVLQWEPKHAFPDAIRDTVAWYREHLALHDR